MKKLISTIIISLFMAVNAYSNHSDFQLEDIPGIWWEKVPTLCLPNEILWEYADEKGMQPLNVSYGRAGAKPDGEIVYIVTYWVGIETNETMASVQVPEGDYSCVLFRTFDTQLNPGFNFDRLDI